MAGEAPLGVTAAALAGLAAILASMPAAHAAEIEVVPFYGLRSGGGVQVEGLDADLDEGSAHGLSIGCALKNDGWLEILWSHQETDFTADGPLPAGGRFGIDVDSLHAAGVYRPDRGGRQVEPFVGMSAGITLFRAEPHGFDDDWALSAGASAGADIPLGERAGVRLLVRGWVYFGDISLAGGCVDGACEVEFAAAGTLHLEIAAGLVLRFP